MLAQDPIHDCQGIGFAQMGKMDMFETTDHTHCEL